LYVIRVPSTKPPSLRGQFLGSRSRARARREEGRGELGRVCCRVEKRAAVGRGRPRRSIGLGRGGLRAGCLVGRGGFGMIKRDNQKCFDSFDRAFVAGWSCF
jgi:hypothetical protein